MDWTNSQPETKTELIERIRQAREELEKHLAALTPEQLSEPGPEGWSIKDHLLHIVEWQRFLLGFLQGRTAHEWLGVAERVSSMEVDAINDILYERQRERPVEQALADFRQSYDEVLAALENLPEENLRSPFWVLDTSEQYLLQEGISSNTCDHDMEHLGWIRRDFLTGV